MILAFELSMPGAASWNGRWSGEGRCHAIVRSIRKREDAEKLVGYHSYSWSDGWRATITVREVTSSQARSLRKRSVGFSGYDWMVDSLIARGKILADHEIRTELGETPTTGKEKS